jgi:hypothetical protein
MNPSEKEMQESLGIYKRPPIRKPAQKPSKSYRDYLTEAASKDPAYIKFASRKHPAVPDSGFSMQRKKDG